MSTCDTQLIIKLCWRGALIASWCKPISVQLVIMLREDLWESLLHLKRFCLQSWVRSLSMAPAFMSALSVSARLGAEKPSSVKV